MTMTQTVSTGSQAPEASFGSLTLLREWQSVCDAVAAGRNHVLIRKGGVAEGRDGFKLRKTFFGLLPTLFHQVKNADAEAAIPEPPRVVGLVCQLVEAFSVASLTDLSALAPYHGYDVEQLAARQQYKPDRALSLILIRPFRLRQSIEIEAGQVKAMCRSWIDLPLNAGLGGIEAVIDPMKLDPILDDARRAIESLPDVQRVDV